MCDDDDDDDDDDDNNTINIYLQMAQHNTY